MIEPVDWVEALYRNGDVYLSTFDPLNKMYFKELQRQLFETDDELLRLHLVYLLSKLGSY